MVVVEFNFLFCFFEAVLEQGDETNANILSPQWLGSFNETTMKRTARRKRQAPGTVWPEVLLVVDYDSFMLHGATSRDVKRYFISFWNGVDLRYKLLAHPQIRVSLAGMIVAKVCYNFFKLKKIEKLILQTFRIEMQHLIWNEIVYDHQMLMQLMLLVH